MGIASRQGGVVLGEGMVLAEDKDWVTCREAWAGKGVLSPGRAAPVPVCQD